TQAHLPTAGADSRRTEPTQMPLAFRRESGIPVPLRWPRLPRRRYIRSENTWYARGHGDTRSARDADSAAASCRITRGAIGVETQLMRGREVIESADRVSL